MPITRGARTEFGHRRRRDLFRPLRYNDDNAFDRSNAISKSVATDRDRSLEAGYMPWTIEQAESDRSPVAALRATARAGGAGNSPLLT